MSLTNWNEVRLKFIFHMIFPPFSEHPNIGITVKRIKRIKIYLFVNGVLGIEDMGTIGSQTNTRSSCFNDFHKWNCSDSFMNVNTNREGQLRCGFTRDSSNSVPHREFFAEHRFTFFFFFPLVGFILRWRATEKLKLWNVYRLPDAAYRLPNAPFLVFSFGDIRSAFSLSFP